MRSLASETAELLSNMLSTAHEGCSVNCCRHPVALLQFANRLCSARLVDGPEAGCTASAHNSCACLQQPQIPDVKVKLPLFSYCGHYNCCLLSAHRDLHIVATHRKFDVLCVLTVLLTWLTAQVQIAALGALTEGCARFGIC